MITPLENRSAHTLNLSLSNAKDKFLEIFYKALSCLNSDYNEYALYYSRKYAHRNLSLKFYGGNVIQTSLNRLYPGKQVPIPNVTLKGDYELSGDEIKPSLSGLCSGACIDHMNRVRSSTKSFFEAIKAAADKFINGCTKKGYIYHHSISKIEPSNDWCLDKIDDPAFNDHYYAKTLSFFTKNYECLFHPNGINDLPEGDYFIRQKALNGLHVICLYKRSEGAAVFDPNYGTLYFKDDQSLQSFLENSSQRMFKDTPVKMSAFRCQEAAC